MKPLNGIKGLRDYLVWERETRDLCHAGKDITHAVNGKLPALGSDAIVSFIQKGNFLDLTPDLQAPLQLRKQYWLDKQPEELISKIESYPSVLEDRFEQYKALGSPGGVFGVYVWLHSTVDIAKSAFRSGILTQEQYQALDDRTKALIQKGTQYFQEETPKGAVSPGIYHDSILESNTRYVVRHLAHNLKNIFRIVERDQRTFFLEVFEKWDFKQHRIAICVPISIGCPNRCHQCNFGVLIPYHRPLTSNEIFSLIYTNAIINDDVTSLFFEPSELTIYYLGGGDPGDNIEEIEKVVQKTHQFYYGDQVLPFVEWIRDNHQRANGNQSGYPFEQIVSTIGLDNGSLDRLIDLARTIPELNIQISVNAFDEQARACTISNLEKVMSIERCVRAAEKFYGVTSATENPRRAFLSIFLLQDVYDDLDKIMDDIERLKIDKTRVHITLDVLRHPPQFIHQPASIGRYKALHRKLRREGYSASIYYPPEDSTTEEGCGIISTHLLERVYGNAEIN